MRTISSTGLTRSVATVQRTVWVLELTAGDWTWRAATRGVSVAGEPWPARLAVEDWREAMPGGEAGATDSRGSGLPGGRIRASADLVVLDLESTPLAGATDSLKDHLATTPPIGIEATLRLAWLGANNEIVSLADTAVMVRGRLAEWRLTATGVRLHLIDELDAQAGRRIGRLLRREMFAGAALPGGEESPWLGRPLPWVVGRMEEAELVPLRVGVVGRLAEDVAADAAILPLADVDGFSPQGWVQIGDEMIEYTAINAAAGTLGSAVHPVSRGAAPQAHARGSQVRRVPPCGFQFLAADHPCRAVASVRADGVPLAAGEWTSGFLVLGNDVTQAVTLARWPVNAEGRPARTITAAIEGAIDDHGNLIENPARVIQWLLTASRLGGLVPARLDDALLSAVEAELAASGYRYARRLTGAETLGELIDSAAREACVWVGAGDPIRLARIHPTPAPADVARDLDATQTLVADAPALVRAPAGYLPPDAVELVGAPRTQGRGRPSLLFPPERESSGAIPFRINAEWLIVDAAGAAGDLGETAWSHLGEAPFIHRQRFAPGVGLLGAGEVIRLTDGAPGLFEALGWVSALEMDKDGWLMLTARGPWAGAYCWKQDLSNYIRRHAFGGLMSFVLAGRPVARLTRAGTLRLRGRLTEMPALAGGPFGAPVAIAEGCLWLATEGSGADGSGEYWPFMKIDASGNATLAGTVRERSAATLVAPDEGLGADNERFVLSTDARTGGFEYEGEDRVLHLKGILIEEVRL